MFLNNFFAFASVSVLVSSLVTGCAAESGTEDATSGEAALINPSNEGTFKLYEDGTLEPNPACDIHSVLELVHPSREGALEAHLHEAVGGFCKIAVNADERAYALKLDSTECGSKIYKGTSWTAEGRVITITDHRNRYCRDVVPAQILVEEATASARTRTLHSYDGPRAAAEKAN